MYKVGLACVLELGDLPSRIRDRHRYLAKEMKNSSCIPVVTFLLAILFAHEQAIGQHCPPITESFLSSSSVKRTKQGLSFKVGYSKTGGQPKKAYQAYIVAYSENNSDKIASLTPQQAIKDGLATIVHTQVAAFNVASDAPRAVQQTDELGEYRVTYELNTEQFVEKMTEAKQIGKTTSTGGWKSYDDEIRLAVFIPYLEDENYSVLEGLPEDKHECNYGGESALLFQPLTQKLTIAFGIVRANRLAEGEYFIELNGKRGLPENVK